jgi:putative radical SAM enzyme (TIGR03279 family)
MLKNEKLADIIPSLDYLTKHEIKLHTQVVLCPGVNDGIYLEKTINDLSELHPGVITLAVVPVGLTRYRKNLPNLRTYNQEEAAEVIDYVESRQKQFLKESGTRFVWPADEFYIAAQRPFPPLTAYEGCEQFENGIGMARDFINAFNRRRAGLKKIKSDKRALFFTGYSAYSFIEPEIMPYVREELKLKIDLVPVVNKFWGDKVTVSGLLTGQDLLREARARSDQFDTVVLPPNCLNNDDLFLDNLSLRNFELSLKKEVVVGQYNLADTIREVFQ